MKKIYKISVEGKSYEVELEEVKTVEGSVTTAPKTQTSPITTGGNISIKAPMPGKIADIKVNVGDKIEKGQVVAILEAMKMETEIVSSDAGVVSEIKSIKGDNVNLDDLIMTIN